MQGEPRKAGPVCGRAKSDGLQKGEIGSGDS